MKGAGKVADDGQAGAAWPDEIYRELKRAGVMQASYVPDAGHSALEPGIRRALVAAVERFRDQR